MTSRFTPEGQMRYHNNATRVAARPLSTEAPPSAPMTKAEKRAQLRTLGRELEALFRTDLGAMVDALPRAPEPREIIADLRRGRAASFTTAGAALALLGEIPECAAPIDAFADRAAALIRSFAHQAPTCLMDAHRAELEAQYQGDGAITEVLAQPSLPAIDRAVASTALHIAQSQRLLVQLNVKRRRVAGERAVRMVRS